MYFSQSQLVRSIGGVKMIRWGWVYITMRVPIIHRAVKQNLQCTLDILSDQKSHEDSYTALLDENLLDPVFSTKLESRNTKRKRCSTATSMIKPKKKTLTTHF